MSNLPSKDEILGYECRHAVYLPGHPGSPNDAVFIKEMIHCKDGRVIPNHRLIKNYQRDFYVTREGYRKHTDKKQSERIDRLQKHTCTQKEMLPKIARLFKRNLNNLQLRQMARSPYLYGTDISTPAIIKHGYRKRWSECSSAARVAVLDIETNMVGKGEEIICISVTSKENVVIAVVKSFIESVPNWKAELEKKFEYYLSDMKNTKDDSSLNIIKARNIQLEIIEADTPGQACAAVIARAHEIKPDWMAVWNIDFDLPRVMEALQKDGYNLADVFSDPSVPAEFRYCHYKQGSQSKLTASGKHMPLAPDERWHVFTAPSSFYWIDSMCVYSMIRKAKGRKQSYALDAILNDELGLRKLKFKEADAYEKGAWHTFMQTYYKIEYLVYNIFDCISVEMLDEKTKDLEITISELCEHSEYQHMNSTPQQLADDLHFFYLDRGRVIASRSDQMADENDESVVSMDGWIITLAAHLVADEGLKLFSDVPNIRSLWRMWVSDLDVKSAYPYTQIILNISKATTMLELCSIEGVLENDRRIAGLNMTGGDVNVIDFCTRIYKAPQLIKLAEQFELEHDLPFNIEYDKKAA